MASLSNAVRFYKYSYLLFDLGPITLALRLNEEIKKEKLTFSVFLENKKHALFQLYETKPCCQCRVPRRSPREQFLTRSQWHSIFKESGTVCSTNTLCICAFEVVDNIKGDALDISLLACILLKVCHITEEEREKVTELRKQLDNFHATFLQNDIDETTFQAEFSILTEIVVTIASSCGPSYREQIQMEIQNLTDNPLTDNMCSRVITVMYNVNRKTQDQILDLQRCQKELSGTFQQQRSSDEDHMATIQSSKSEVKSALEKLDSIENLRKKDHEDIRLAKENAIHIERKLEVVFEQIMLLNKHVENDFRDTHKNIEDFLQIISEQIENVRKNQDTIVKKQNELCKRIGIVIRNEATTIATQTGDNEGTLDCTQTGEAKLLNQSSSSDSLNEVTLISTQTSDNEGTIPCTPIGEDMTLSRSSNLDSLTSKINAEIIVTDDSAYNSSDFLSWDYDMPSSQYLCDSNIVVQCSDRSNSDSSDCETVLSTATVFKMCQKAYTETEDSVEDLRIACSEGNANMFNKILRNFQNKNNLIINYSHAGMFLVHFASQGGSIEILRTFTEKLRVSAFTRTTGKMTILHIACQNNHLQMVVHIVKTYSDMKMLVDENDWNATHYAAKCGNIEILSALLENEIIATNQTSDGRNILHIACENGRESMVKWIILKFPAMITEMDDKGLVFAHFAVKSGLDAILKLAENSSTNLMQCTYSGSTIFHIACQCSNLSLCRYIVSKYSTLLHKEDSQGLVGIHFAAKSGCIEIFEFLVANGIDPYIRSKKNVNVLQYACFGGQENMFQYLLKKYPSMVTNVSKNGYTTSHFAAMGGKIEIFKTLIDFEDYKKQSDFTFLQSACSGGHPDMCRYILNRWPFIASRENNLSPNAAHFAAKNGNIDVMELILQRGISITLKTKENESILHIACQFGNLKMTEYILTKCPYLVDSLTMNGWSAMHCAAHGGNTQIFDILISKGLNFSQLTKDRRTVLHIGCINGKHRMVGHILLKYPSLVDEKDNRGWNPLHYAAAVGCTEVMEKYDCFGIDPTKKTTKGLNILHIACVHENFQMCSYIVRKYPGLLAEVDENSWNASHFASYVGNVAILNLLAEYGVDVYHTTILKYTILTIACLENHADMVKFISKNFPKLLYKRNIRGWNASHFAAAKGNEELLKILSSNGLDMQEMTNKYETILHLASESHNISVCKYILKNHQNLINNVDNTGWNSAHFTARGGNLETMKLLVSHGININHTTFNNATVLHIACMNSKEICSFIIKEYPLMIQEVDKNGWSALHYAAFGGIIEILETLIGNGMDVLQTSYRMDTILHIACQNVRRKANITKHILDNYPHIINNINSVGWNAVHFAAEGGNVEILSMLSETDLDLTDRTNNLKTILHIACENGNTDMVQYILMTVPAIKDLFDDDGYHALHSTASRGHIETFESLILGGVDPMQITRDLQLNVFHVACQENKETFCNHVLRRYPSLLKSETVAGWNAAHYVARTGSISLLQSLAARGLDVCKDTKGRSNILLLACKYKRVRMVEYILSRYPDLKERTDREGNNAEITQWLRETLKY